MEALKGDIESLRKIRDALFEALENTKDSSSIIEDGGVVENASGEPVVFSDGNGGIKLSQKAYEEGGRNILTQGDEIQEWLEKKGTVKFSIKEGMSENERYNELLGAELLLAEYSGNTAKLTKGEIDSLEQATRRDARKYVQTLYDKFDLGKTYKNQNVNIEFLFSKGGFNESVSKQNSRNPDFAAFGRMLSCFDEIIQNAIPLEIHGDKYAGTKREDPSLERVFVLFSAYSDKNIVPVQLEVKELNRQDNQLYVAVALNKIRAEVFATTQHFHHDSSGVLSVAAPSSSISLQDLFKNINPLDGEFLKYVPDGFLNSEQRTAKNSALDRERHRIDGYRFSLKDDPELVNDVLSAYPEMNKVLSSLETQEATAAVRKMSVSRINRCFKLLLLNIPKLSRFPQTCFAFVY